MIGRRTFLLGSALAGLAAATTGCAALPVPAPPDVPPRLYTDWRRHPDGPLPPTGDDGVPFTLALSGPAGPPVVRTGALQGALAGAGAASYVTQPLGMTVRRIGAEFGFGPGGDGGSLALVAWVAGQDTLSTHCHIVVTPTGWIAGTTRDSVLNEIDSGEFDEPLLRDGSPYLLDVTFEPPVATLSLPDGTRRRIRDGEIGRIPGSVPGWEFYQAVPGSSPVVLHRSWAG